MSKLLANQIANYGDDAPVEIKEGLNIPAGKPIQAAGSVGSSGQVLSSTGTSIEWVTPFDGNYNSLTNKPSIPAAQVQADWNSTSGVSLILNKPVVPLQPSVTTASAGSASLSYNSTNGEFTFTPPDLSGYATEAWVGTQGYLTTYSEVDTLATVTGRGATTSSNLTFGGTTQFNTNSAFANDKVLNFGASSNGRILYVSATNSFDVRVPGGAEDLKLGAGTAVRITNENGLTDRAVFTTSGLDLISGDITTTGKIYYSNNFANSVDLPSATTYHGMFAHVHAEGHGYFAHAGAWTQLLDTGSSINDLADVNLATAPQSGQVLAYDGANWVATAAGGGGGGISLSDISVSTALTGTAALSYNNISGVFTYTPPDLSSYAETGNLTIANWDTAYGWGDHSTAGYAADTNVVDWNTAYGWGDHAQAGYLTAEADTLATVTGRGATTSVKIIANGGVRADVLGVGGGIGNGDVQLQHNGVSNVSTLEHFNVNGSLEIKSVSGINIKPGTTEGGSVSIYHDPDGSTETLRLQTTATGATISGALTAGGLTYPTTNGTSGDVLTSDGAGNVAWQASAGGGGGASVTISDTIPAGTPSAGNLWWESDTGRLKIYYTDVDSSQWIDASPPLRFNNIDDIVTANGFKFRTNPSSPPVGTLGELKQINGKPYFYDGTAWQEFIFANSAVTTIPAETDWDKVLLRSTFDSDFNDVKFGDTGTPAIYGGIATSTLVGTPAKFGAKVLKTVGNGVRYDDRSDYDFTGEFTIEFWINIDSAPSLSGANDKYVIVSKATGTLSGSNNKTAGVTGGGWQLYYAYVGANIGWRLDIHDTATNTIATLGLQTDSSTSFASKFVQSWNHIALVKESDGQLHFYVNGLEDITWTKGINYSGTNMSNTSEPILFGGSQVSANTAGIVDAFIDDIRVTRDARYTSSQTSNTQSFTPPTSAHPVSGSTTTYTPPATSSAGSFTLGASPAWTGTLGVTVAQQSSGNYRLTFANPFTNATDYYVFAHHMDGAEAMVVASVRSAGYIDFSVKNVAGSLIDTGSLAVQIIAH